MRRCSHEPADHSCAAAARRRPSRRPRRRTDRARGGAGSARHDAGGDRHHEVDPDLDRRALAARAPRRPGTGDRHAVPTRRRQPGDRPGAASGTWRSVVSDRTDARGRFVLLWRPSRLGSEALRLRFAGDAQTARTARDAGRITVYRTALASWYALYGNPLACGGTLEHSSSASRTGRCRAGPRSRSATAADLVTVPVLDRGPYSGGREFDLTGATAAPLGVQRRRPIWVTR